MKKNIKNLMVGFLSLAFVGAISSAAGAFDANDATPVAVAEEIMPVADGVATVNGTAYATIDDAIAAWTNGTTLKLTANVTLTKTIELLSTEYHILDLGTFTMTAASKKDAIQIVNNGRTSASYALDITADATNPGGITASGKAVVKTTGKSGVKDRPIIRFYNGVFTGTNIVYHSGSNGTNCPQFWYYGGEFNGTIYSNRALHQFHGGTFNGNLQISVDSSAYALISGGRFKSLSNLYGSALNSDKFTIGSSKGNYDREVYVDDEGYYVVATQIPTIEAVVAETYSSNNYFYYSQAAKNGMNYTDVTLALKNNLTKTVTVNVDELDMEGINFTGTIVVPEGKSLKIKNAPAGLKTEGDVTLVQPAATVNGVQYETLADAIAEAPAGAEIVLMATVTEDITIDKSVTIKGSNARANATYTGTMTITGDHDVTIENVDFVKGYIVQNGSKTTATLTVKGCSFANGGYAVTTEHIKNLIVEDCTVQTQSLIYAKLTTSYITVKNVTIDNGNYLAHFVYGSEATFENVTATNMPHYGICTQNYGAKTITLKNCNFDARLPLATRNDRTSANDTFVFEGTNTMNNLANADNVIYKMAAGATVKAPEGVTISMKTPVDGYEVAYADGVYSIVETGLKGEGTEANPYQIATVEDLIMFRDSVNAGETKYNAAGKYVALTGDINMAGTDWSVNIGDDCNATFDGIFDGGNFTISNLTSTETAQKGDGYICTGLFGAIGGNAVIKNLTIAGANIQTGDYTGNNVSALVGFAYKATGSIENVTVTNTTINAAKVDGVGAIVGYAFSGKLTISGCTVENTTVNGQAYVGGVIGYAGGKVALTDNTVTGVTVNAKAAAGGVAGIILGGGVADGNTVTNADLTSYHENWLNATGLVAGTFTGNITVTGTDGKGLVGVLHADKPTNPLQTAQASVNGVYYAELKAAIAAATAGDTITLNTNLSFAEILTIDKAITLDGNGYALTSTAGRAINVAVEGNVTIKNLTINASGERAINVITYPATLTVDNVTATAANYTVNAATSAGATTIAITNSNLTGLNVVNIAAPGAYVTVDSTTLNCKDNNTEEGYSVLALNKAATGATIAATNVTFKFTGTAAQDSCKAKNGAIDGTITIDGSTEGVESVVAIIEYANTDNYYSFSTLADAIEKAVAGDTIKLLCDVDYGTTQLAITKAITLDLNGKTLTTRNAYGGMSLKGNCSVVNGTIVHASNTAAIKVWNAEKFENLVIDVQGKGDANKTIGGIVLQSGSTTKVGSIKNVTIKGTALTNGIETYNCGDATENVIGSMENVNIDANGTAMLISAPCGTATNCTFDGDKNGIEIWIKGNYSATLTLVDCTVNTVYAHDEFNGNPSIVNNGTLSITGVAADKVTLELARAENVKGVLAEVKANAQAKLKNVYYATLADAIKAANAGDVVTIFEGTYAMPAMKAGITLVGEGEVMFEGTLTGTLENLTLKNIYIKGGNAQRWAYANGNLVFENVTFEATSVYALHFDDITAGATLTYTNCTIIGWAAMSGSPASCVFDGCTFEGNGSYGLIRTYFDATIENCTFDVANVNTNDKYQDGIHAVEGATVTVNNCTNVNGNMADVVNVSGTSKVVLDGVTIQNVAKIGDNYYATLAEAFAVGGEVVLLKNVELTETLKVAGKTVTLDLNGHVISGTCNAGQSSLIYIENGATLIVNDTAGNGKITYAQGTSNVGWTMDVKGTLVLNAGTIELTGNWSIGYAVDVRPNSWGTEYTVGSVFEMNGGSISSSDGGVRVASSSAAGHKNVSATFVMNNGSIDAAWDGVFVQQSDATYDVLTFTMKGGTISSALNPVRVYGPAATGYVNGTDCMNINFMGGTMTYTGEETLAWVLDGILRVGGGSSIETILESGEITVSAAFAQSVATPTDYKWAANNDGNYTLAKKVYVVAIGETKYESLAAAIKDATAGSTITFMADVAEDVTISKNVNINGAEFKYTGTMTINNVTTTIEGVNFVKGNIYKNKKTGTAAKVTIKNCEFDGEGMDAYAINLGGTNAIVIEDVTAKNCTSWGFLQVPSSANTLTMKDVEVENCYYGIKVDYANSVTLDNVSIDATIGIYDSNYGDKTYTITNSTISSTKIWERNTTNYTTFKFYGNNTIGNIVKSNYATYELAEMTATLTAPKKAGVTTTCTTSGRVAYNDEDSTYRVATAFANNTNFASLAEAVATANNSSTMTAISLLCDSEGAGFVTTSYIQIDFKGFTYTITSGVGSYDTLGIQQLKGKQLVLRNGTLALDAEAGKNIGILIQSYDNLSITGMTIDGTNLDLGAKNYVISNNNGSFNTNTTNILVNEGDIAFDLCDMSANGYYTATPSASVAATVTINGEPVSANFDKLEVAAKYSIYYYATIEQAIAKHPSCDVMSNVALTDSIEIPAGKTFTLNLNGKTISMTTAEYKSAIVNNGTLTIKGEGAIAMNFTGTPSTAVAVNTIANRGKLTVSGGNISNTGSGNQIGYAIDNYNGATLTVSGGNITASGSSYYDAIRLFCGSNATTVTVKGGYVSSIWAQNPSANKASEVNGSVVVTGGTIDAIYYENYTTVTITTKIAGNYNVVAYGANSENATSAKVAKNTVYSFAN